MTETRFTHDDLRTILVDRIGLAPADIPDDPDTAFTELGLDSLAIVEVQLAVQQRFGFDMPDADAHLMVTMCEAVDYVNRRLAAPEAV